MHHRSEEAGQGHPVPAPLPGHAPTQYRSRRPARAERAAPAARAVLAAAGALLALWAAPARADLLIGQTAGFTGPAAAGVKEAADGAHLVFDALNAQGGLHGQKIVLKSLDDGFEPKRSAANAATLAQDGAIALFLSRGTPHTQALLPVLAEARIPLVGPSTGAMVLHQPVNPWVFNVRTSYQRETERTVQHLTQIGVSRLAVAQVDDSFGNDAVQGALRALKARQLAAVALQKFDRDKPDLTPLIAAIVKADPQAVLTIGTGQVVADIVARLRAAGSHAQVATLSNNASAGFIKSLGAFSHGVLVSQVFPSERATVVPMVRDAADALRAQHPGQELTPAMLEGYAAAKVLVEGLRRAGKDPSRASLQKALESMGRYDLGGLEVSFSPTDHTGLDLVDLSIIDARGHFTR